MADRPRLEVIVFTYNHEAFVAQALRSVLAQRTDFPIGIRIHDDASTDRTVEEITGALADAPVPWELVRAPQNRYATGTDFYHQFIAESRSEFVAILDGDDFWVDPEKLQLQVDLLERNPSAAICHHPVFEFVGGQLRPVDWPPSDFRTELLPGERLSEANPISSSSVVIRRSMFPDRMPDGYNELGIGDYPMWALAAMGRDVAFIDRRMTAYRVHTNNIFAALETRHRVRRELDARLFIWEHALPTERGAWRAGILAAIDYRLGETVLLEDRLATCSHAL